jgi:hypothetical protein
MLDALVHAGSKTFWFVTGALALSAAAGILWGMARLRQSRTIIDTPTSKIHAAHQGYVELEGVGRIIDLEIASPLTGAPCVWWHYKVEEKIRRQRNEDAWLTLEEFSSEEPFWLEDETGRCRVEPARAEIDPVVARTWYGETRADARNQEREASTGRYRYTERLLLRGEPLYAIGDFRSVNVDPSEGNLSGRVDTLTRAGERQFLLSARSQREIAARFRTQADGGIAWFVLAGAAVVWLIRARFG